MQTFRTRISFLAMCVAITLIVVACGRASQDDIDNALGITQVPTLSAEEQAQATELAISKEGTREAYATQLAASPGAGGGSVDIASAGNPALGASTFMMRCMGCHKAGGMAPDLAGPSSPLIAMTDQQILDLLRTGTGHTPPGPLTTVDISDSQMPNLLAYLRDKAK
ncbi:MAG TPA: cytochrome c [Thermomicrobiales bacterium]|nr:cytochrome c [Thermomicrobiales bacterium]HRA47505.1 cytochrome c [Thermomicrobiales bacterium]